MIVPGKRISLTQEGAFFLRDAKRLLAECAQSVQAVQRLGRGTVGQLNVAYIANSYHKVLPLTFETFCKVCPRTVLHLFDMTPADQYKALDERTIDLGYVCCKPRLTGSDLLSFRVVQDILMAAVPAGTPLAQKSEIDLKDLEPQFFCEMSEKTYPDCKEWLIDRCREAGFNPKILQEADRVSAAIAFVASGLGVVLLPEQTKRLPHEGVIFRPLRQHIVADSWAIWKRTNSSESLRQYIQIVKELSMRR